MANKSMYTDRANKANSRAKGDFLFTQKGDGSEVSKGAEIEVVLASDLDNMDTSNVLAFNHLAGSIPIANSDNTKAYNGDLAKLLNPNCGIAVNFNDYDTMQLPTNSIDFSKDFSALVAINTQNTEADNFIVLKNDYFELYYIGASNSLRLLIGLPVWEAPLDLNPNKIITLLKVKLGDNYFLKFYANGIYLGEYNLTTNLGLSNIGLRTQGVDGNGSFVSTAIYFNYALSDEELEIICNSGRPDRAILPDYMKWGSNTEKDIGTPINSSLYPYQEFNTTTGVYFARKTTTGVYSAVIFNSIINISLNQSIRLFIDLDLISGTAPLIILQDTSEGLGASLSNSVKLINGINYVQLKRNSTAGSARLQFLNYQNELSEYNINSISVIQLGVICDLAPSGIVCNSSGKVTSWTDSSTNNNDATVSGTPDLVLIKAEDYEGQGMNTNEFIFKTLDASAGANVGDTLFLPPQWSIVRCVAYNYGSTSVNIKLGSTNGGGEYVSSKSIAAGEIVNFNVPDTKDPYSITAFSPMYLNSSSWGSAKVKARFVLMHVPWGE